MALRILSGSITPSSFGHSPSGESHQHAGSATIHFNPHKVSSDAATGNKLTTIGATGDFSTIPAHNLGLNSIVLLIYRPKPGDSMDDTNIEGTSTVAAHIIIDSITKDKLVVRWDSSKDSKVYEFQYMIIGEVE